MFSQLSCCLVPANSSKQNCLEPYKLVMAIAYIIIKNKNPLIMLLNIAFSGPHLLLYYLLYFLTHRWPLWERVKIFSGRVGVWGFSLKWILWLLLYPVKLSFSISFICPSGFGQIFMLLWYILSSVLNLFLHPLNLHIMSKYYWLECSLHL